MTTGAELHGGTKSVKSLLTGSFIIPGYQRRYDWGKLEVSELLNDFLEHAQKHQHVGEVERVPIYLLNFLRL